MIDKGQCWDFGQDTGVTLYEKCHGIFNDNRDSGPRFERLIRKTVLFYSIVSPSLHWGVRTHTDCRVSTPCWSH